MGYFKAPAVSEVTPHLIPPRTTLVELVTEGVIYFRTDSGDMKLGCGALFWHIPGEETIHRTEASDPYECLALAFINPSRSPRPVPRLSIIADHQKTRELCSELLTAYQDDKIDRDVLEKYAYSRMLWEAHLSTAQHSSALHPTALEASLAFVEAEFRRPEIGVIDLARAAKLSEPHIHTLFREHIGQTPHQFLTARRIREAKWQLTRTGATIKAISTDCGFLNIETFYRAFKKTVGTTPFHFRQSNSVPLLENL
jgi:AraC-like DNA-binding protein